MFHRHRNVSFIAAFSTICTTLSLVAQERHIAIKGPAILTMAGQTVESGVVVIHRGKIVAVGKDVSVPAGATVIDARGQYLLPGLVDPHSHLGVYTQPALEANSDGNEMTGPIQSQVRAEDALNTDDPAIARGVSGGVTTVRGSRKRQQHRRLGHAHQAEGCAEPGENQVSQCAAGHEVGLGRKSEARVWAQRASAGHPDG